MDWRRYVREHLPATGLGGAREAGIVEELAQQLESCYAEARRAGAGDEDATARAQAQFPRWAELARDIRVARRPLAGRLPEPLRREDPPPWLRPGRGNIMGDLWMDIRYGLRSLAQSPGFLAVAVLTLALGIGANTAIFELLNAVLLRSLPVQAPQELAEIRNVVRKPRTGNFDGRRAEMTYPMWTRIRERQEGFSSTAAWFTGNLRLSAGGEQRFASNSLWVSGDFFQVLGVRPLLGRLFHAGDDQRGCPAPGVVLSYAFWQREYGGDPGVVGRPIRLNQRPLEIIGVTPQSFFGVEVGRQYSVAIPICADELVNPTFKRLDRLDGWWLAAIGRLKPGWTIERATAQLTAISPALYQETVNPGYTPEDVKNYLALRLGAVPAANGVSGLRSAYTTPLWVLLSATGVLLLITCANLANLMLARASAREREIAVRLALGASRGRLVRQMLTESLLLAALGAVAGAWLARAMSRGIVALISLENNPRFLQLETDWRMVAFTGGLAVLTCILFGLAPALRATRAPLAAAMNAGGRGSTETRERFSLRRALVVSQVALSLMLLAGALLFGRTLQNLMTLDAGFQQDGVLQLDVMFRVPREQRQARLDELFDRLRSTPGVDAVAASSYVPLGGNSWNDNVLVDAPGGERKAVVNFDRVSPGFFETMRIPLVAGRDFGAGDVPGAPAVAVVNESFARKFFDGANPVGRTFRIEGAAGERPLYQIAGLVRDAKYEDLRTEFGPIGYFPARQAPSFGPGDTLVIRSSLSTSALAPAVKRAVTEMDPATAFTVTSLKTSIRQSLVQEQLMATLTGFFGALAAALASIGLYGVLSYAVARRTHEIGIRMALGAGRAAVLRMILRESAGLLAIGLLVGMGLALAAGRATSTLLYGLEPHDPVTLALSAALLAAVALAASYLPARRASGVDPLAALRHE